MSLDPNFCKRADVYDCARNDHGILITALMGNPAVTLVVLFIFRLAVYGSFSYAKQTTVSGMVSAAFGTLVGKKAASYDDAWRSLGSYGARRPVPPIYYLFYVGPFLFWLLIYYVYPDIIAYVAMATAMIMMALRNTVDQRTIYFHGGCASGLVFVIFQLMVDKLGAVSDNDEQFFMMVVSMAVFVWALVTFLASLNSPPTRAIAQKWGAAQAQTARKQQFDNIYIGTADRFGFVYNADTTQKRESELKQLQNEFALKFAKAQSKRLLENKPPLDLATELRKFAEAKGLPIVGAPILPPQVEDAAADVPAA